MLSKMCFYLQKMRVLYFFKSLLQVKCKSDC
jgi:hypothetical protein